MIPPPDLEKRGSLNLAAFLFLKEIWPLGKGTQEPQPGNQVVG